MSTPNRYLLGLVLLFAAMGTIDCFTATGSRLPPFSVVYWMVFSGLVFGWSKAHAAARGRDAPALAALLAGYAAPLGVPLYFLRSMPFGKALLSIAKATLFYVVLVAVYLTSLTLLKLAVNSGLPS